MQAVDTQFDDGPFAYFHDLLFDLFAGLFDDLFDAGGVDAAVGDQPLQGQAGDLAAQGVEGGEHDGFRCIIHDEVYSCGGFYGPDITAFSADDLAFDLVAFQIEYGDRVLDGLFGGCTLDALDDDLAGFFVGALFGVVDDLLLEGEGPGLGFLSEAFDEL